MKKFFNMYSNIYYVTLMIIQATFNYVTEYTILNYQWWIFSILVTVLVLFFFKKIFKDKF